MTTASNRTSQSADGSGDAPMTYQPELNLGGMDGIASYLCTVSAFRFIPDSPPAISAALKITAGTHAGRVLQFLINDRRLVSECLSSLGISWSDAPFVTCAAGLAGRTVVVSAVGASENMLFREIVGFRTGDPEDMDEETAS